MIHVSRHAAERFIQRVRPGLSHEAAVAEITRSAPAIVLAASIRCRTIKLGCGAKLVLQGTTVVTVIGRDAAKCWSEKGRV